MQNSNDYTDLLQALTLSGEDTLTCADCEAQLPDCIQALTQGDAEAVQKDERWRDLIRHIQGCPRCLQLYRDLTAMVGTFYADVEDIALGTASTLDHTQVEEVGSQDIWPAMRQPDLTFLQQTADRPLTASKPKQRNWWQDAVGRLFIVLADTLLEPLQPGNQLNVSAVGLKQATEDDNMATVSHVEKIDEENSGQISKVTITVHYSPTATITATAAATRRDQCSVEVEITVPTRPLLTLDGIAIALQGEAITLDTQWTDALGRVVFTGVPIDQLSELYCAITPMGEAT